MRKLGALLVLVAVVGCQPPADAPTDGGGDSNSTAAAAGPATQLVSTVGDDAARLN